MLRESTWKYYWITWSNWTVVNLWRKSPQVKFIGSFFLSQPIYTSEMVAFLNFSGPKRMANWSCSKVLLNSRHFIAEKNASKIIKRNWRFSPLYDTKVENFPQRFYFNPKDLISLKMIKVLFFHLNADFIMSILFILCLLKGNVWIMRLPIFTKKVSFPWKHKSSTHSQVF